MMLQKEMSRAVWVQKLQEAQEANALWKLKPAQDVGEKYCDPSRADIPGAKQDTICTLGRAPDVCGTFILEVSARVLGGRSVLQWLSAFSKVCGKSLSGKAFGPTWIGCAREVRAARRTLFLLE